MRTMMTAPEGTDVNLLTEPDASLIADEIFALSVPSRERVTTTPELPDLAQLHRPRNWGALATDLQT